MRLLERLAVRLGVGEDLLLRRERRVLVGVVDLGRVDLRELVAQQVELTRARSVVAADLLALLFERRRSARAAESVAARRRGGLTRELVEQRALLGGNRATTGARAGRAGRRARRRARRARHAVASRPSM